MLGVCWYWLRTKKRWKFQLAATIASNPFILNFFQGKIHKGNSKIVCVPGLNCYSCPAAAASCPIGSLQAVIGSSKFHFAYYIVGFLILIGVLLGRVVCGFLCPFGWFQELLHKIPTKKFSTKRLHLLTYLKYVILVLFVIVLPMTVVNEVGLGDPFFCKYICPAGILEGGIPLSIADAGIRAILGELFTWKSCILLGIVVLSRVLLSSVLQMDLPTAALFTPCSTRFLSTGLRLTRINVLPAVLAAMSVKWTWTYSALPTTRSASAAGIVFAPVLTKRSPRAFP